MTIDALYADGIDSDLQRWAANPGPAPEVGFSATSFLGSGLKGAPAAALETAGSVADVLSSFGAASAASGGTARGMFSLPNEEEKRQEAKAREQMLKGGFNVGAGNVLRRKAEEFSPDPQTSHTADQVLFGLTRFGTKAVAAVGTMGPAGALVLGADEANTATQQLRMKGVDDATAAKVGAVQGAVAGVSVVLPIAGRTIMETLGLVAAGGPGAYMVQEKLSKDILQRAGYADEASLHNPFDPLGLAISTVIPGAFGALHMRGVRATKLEEVVQHIESGGRRYGKDGKLLTSPKGAQGEMQVMPGTAKDPGFGVAPAKDDSPEELVRVGRDYLGAMVNRYGNQDQALAAYNAGPGAVDAAIKAHGENWLAKLPKETQDYVAKARKLTGDYAATEGAADPAAVDAARVTTLNDTVARSLPDTPDAHAQVMRAGDIVAERGGRAAEQEIAPPSIRAYHRTTVDFEGDFQNGENALGVSFAGKRGFYFSREIDDPSALVFGNRVIEADVSVTRPAPVEQLKIGGQEAPRAVLPADPEWIVSHGVDPREGGLVVADNVAEAKAGKFHPDTGANFNDRLKALETAANEGRLFRLINPERLNDSDVALLEKHGFDGFDYTKPDGASSAMPSQVVALRPEQIRRTDRAAPREANNSLPPADSVSLAGDAPAARGDEMGATKGEASTPKAEQSLDAALAQKLATEFPDLQVVLPGSQEPIGIADALKRIAEEQKQDGIWADLVKVATECALGA